MMQVVALRREGTNITAAADCGSGERSLRFLLSQSLCEVLPRGSALNSPAARARLSSMLVMRIARFDFVAMRRCALMRPRIVASLTPMALAACSML
jgi:hypothetical protein